MKANFASIPKLGFGCMRLPLLDAGDPTSIDIKHFSSMVDAFVEGGGSYFDTAYVYHNGASEVALRKALVERYPRESFTVATKCQAWGQPTAEAAQACLATSMQRLGVDYLDFYLLHNVSSQRAAKYDEYNMWDWIQAKKEEGLIKNIGCSVHDSAANLDELLSKHPYMDFVQLQVNYLDWDDPVTEAKNCMAVAEKHSKPVCIMEPARGGRLAQLPQRSAKILKAAAPDKSQTSWAYRFCYNLPNVITVLSGMSTLAQVQENVREFHEQTPFTPAEKAALSTALEALRSIETIPCTNCRYCTEGCPQGIRIPTILGLINLEKMTEDHDFVKGLYSWQAEAGPASHCIQCAACEDICPQSIPIVKHLEEAAVLYE